MDMDRCAIAYRKGVNAAATQHNLTCPYTVRELIEWWWNGYHDYMNSHVDASGNPINLGEMECDTTTLIDARS